MPRVLEVQGQKGLSVSAQHGRRRLPLSPTDPLLSFSSAAFPASLPSHPAGCSSEGWQSLLKGTDRRPRCLPVALYVTGVN